jgi:hypothetical protein
MIKPSFGDEAFVGAGAGGIGLRGGFTGPHIDDDDLMAE